MSERPVAHVDPLIWGLIPDFIAARDEDATTIEGHLAAGDAAAVVRIGHNLKGNGAAYGFPELSRIGAALELAAKAGDLDGLRTLHRALRRYLDTVEIRQGEG